MPNTNPQAIRFSNERARPLCDRLAQAYHFASELQKQIAAEGIEGLFSKDGDVIDDGAAVDGRSPLTNDDVKGVLNAIDTYVQFLDGNPVVRDLVLRVAVNPIR